MTREQRIARMLRNADAINKTILRELEAEHDAELELLAREAYLEGPASE